MRGGSTQQQVAITRREYAGRGKVESRCYRLTLAQEVLDRIGVSPPESMDVTAVGLDDVEMLRFLDEVVRSFAEFIDFGDPEGVDLREQVPLIFDATGSQRLSSRS